MRNTLSSIAILLTLAAFARAGDAAPTLFDVLYGSANYKRLDQLKELVSKGVDVNAPFGYHRMLYEGEDAAASVAAGTLKPTAWPLDIAIEQAQVEMVSFLLAKGAKLHGGELARAVFAGNGTTSLVMTKALLEAGADVNGSRGTFTALFWASFKGNKECVELLLTQPGIKLDQTDIDGQTALMAAVENGHVEIASMLLKAGARADIPDKRGRTATGIAKGNLAKQQTLVAALQSQQK
ncbi:MAG: ankyrin repeat domain-containing protein [Verrucomicrobiota bacterium]